MKRRSEIKRDYKAALKTAGIFQITCTANGKILLGSSLNLHGPLNRHKMELRTGIHKNRELLSDWHTFGADSFTFEIVDSVTDSTASGFNLSDELTLMEELWLEKLHKENKQLYNTDTKIRQA